MPRFEVARSGRVCRTGLGLEESGPGKKGGLTRREWLRLSVAASAGVAVGALGAYEFTRLLGPPTTVEGEIRDTLYYTRSPDPQNPQWWDALAGEEVRVTDFGEWQGATALWRALVVAEQPVPNTGLPVLVIRVKRDDSAFSAPPPGDVALPPGFSLYYDDPARDIRIVVVYSRCTHPCCSSSWHISPVPSIDRNYIVKPRTSLFNEDPIYCACHGAQFDPMALVSAVHPNGTRYVGAQRVHGPASRALPVVPVRANAYVLVGGMADPRWYASYCK